MTALGQTIILRGLPGSGKSTKTRESQLDAVVCSADDFLIEPDGSYFWTKERRTQAHYACLKKFTANIQTEKTLIVDNTNTTIAEIAPYYALSKAFGRSTTILTFDISPELSAQRNLHQVPGSAIRRMHFDMLQAEKLFPAYWHHVLQDGT